MVKIQIKIIAAGKLQEWKAVVLIPFINPEDFRTVIGKAEEEIKRDPILVKRNSFGKSVIFASSQVPWVGSGGK